jgi:hypothetical protein
VRRCRRLDVGFSLVEVLVATAITIAVTALTCGLALEAHQAWRADGARADLQQRGRVASDMLARTLLGAGIGPQTGSAKGPLIRSLAPIVPRRTGRLGADPASVVRSDAFTVVTAVPEAEHGMLLVPFASGEAAIEISPAPACDLPACGFSEGHTALVFDGNGNHDLFTVLRVTGWTLSLRHQGGGSHPVYPRGSPVLAVEPSTFYLDRAARTLRRYDGDASDLPVVDDVVDMEVRYYGDIRPPRLPMPRPGASNCLYDATGAYRSVLLPVLPAAGSDQAVLSEADLTDGPWCGDGSNRFDADLLRVRRVRVAVRLQAADPAVRGSDAIWFREPGSARRPAMLVSDSIVIVDTAPRNLRGGR